MTRGESVVAKMRFDWDYECAQTDLTGNLTGLTLKSPAGTLLHLKDSNWEMPFFINVASGSSCGGVRVGYR